MYITGHKIDFFFLDSIPTVFTVYKKKKMVCCSLKVVLHFRTSGKGMYVNIFMSVKTHWMVVMGCFCCIYF